MRQKASDSTIACFRFGPLGGRFGFSCVLPVPPCIRYCIDAPGRQVSTEVYFTFALQVVYRLSDTFIAHLSPHPPTLLSVIPSHHLSLSPVPRLPPHSLSSSGHPPSSTFTFLDHLSHRIPQHTTPYVQPFTMTNRRGNQNHNRGARQHSSRQNHQTENQPQDTSQAGSSAQNTVRRPFPH